MDVLSKIYFVLLASTLISYTALFEKTKAYKRYILIYNILILLTSIIALYLMNTPAKNNLVVFHVFTVLEYVVLSLLYYRYLYNSVLKKFILISIPFFLLTSIMLSLFVQKITMNNSYAILLESILLTSYSLFFLRELLVQTETNSLLSFPMFWISVGILFYFIGSLIVEGLLNYLMKYSMDLALRIYKLSYIFKYLLFIMLTIGVFSDPPVKKKVSQV